MVWPLIAMAALSAVSSGQQAGAQAKSEIAQNKAIREANTTNTIRTGFQVGMLQVQKGQKTFQRAQRSSELSQDELNRLSSTANTAAAAGNVGASVDAVQSDIELQFDRARASLSLEGEIEAQNYNTALQDLIQGGQDRLGSAVKSSAPSGLAVLGSAAISTAGTYYGSKMSLGLGTQSNTQITRG